MRGPWLFAGKTAPLYNQRWNGRRPELKFLTVEKREGGGGDHRGLESAVRSVTARSPLPRERPLWWVGGWEGAEGPATKLIGNLLAKPPAGGGIFLSRDGKMPARNKKSTLLRILGNERDVWDRRWWRGQQLTGQESCRAEGKEFKKAFLPPWGRPRSWMDIWMHLVGQVRWWFKVWWNERVRETPQKVWLCVPRRNWPTLNRTMKGRPAEAELCKYCRLLVCMFLFKSCTHR